MLQYLDITKLSSLILAIRITHNLSLLSPNIILIFYDLEFTYGDSVSYAHNTAIKLALSFSPTRETTYALLRAETTSSFALDYQYYTIVIEDVDNAIIFDITDPANPSQIYNITTANSLLTGGIYDVDIFEINTATYAAISGYNEIIIFDISDPHNPQSITSITEH